MQAISCRCFVRLDAARKRYFGYVAAPLFLTSLQERQPRLRTPCMGVFFIYTFASKTDLHRYQAWGCVQPQVQIRDISENKRQYG